MPRQAHAGKIRRLSDRVQNIAVVCSVILWHCGCDGFLWFHPSAVINILPGSGNINTTIQNPDGEVVPVTVSRSGCLLEVDDGWLNSGVCPIWCVSTDCVNNTYRPSYFSSWQQDLGLLFCACHPIPSDTFPKRSGQLWYWYIFEVIF